MPSSNPIFITGCQRSGLSMVAGVFDCCGAWLGVNGERGPRQDAFENVRLTDGLVLPYLQMTGLPENGSCPVLSMIKGNHWIMPKWAERVGEVLGERRTEGVWAYKSFRIALMWRQWARAFPGAWWIIVRRNQADLANSCIKTGYMKQFQSLPDWVDWAEGWSSLLDDVEANIQDSIYCVWPFKFFQGDLSEIRGAVEGSGLTWNEEAVHNFLPALKEGSK